MANTRSASKRSRQTLRRAARNRSVKTHLRRLQKQIRLAPERTADQVRAAISAIDKAAKNGVIHRNAANRRKAQLNKTLAAAKQENT
jgi:small subunit ribosomal protein S20